MRARDPDGVVALDLLPPVPRVPGHIRRQLEHDFETPPPCPGVELPHWIQRLYGIDVAARYGRLPIRHPFGKASGQLSLNERQVREDAEAGLGFVILKTVIAETRTGERSMQAWAVPESRMRVEHRVARDGRPGWTVTWKGRGWDRSLADYLALLRTAVDIGGVASMPVVASVKYHLPALTESFILDEFEHTTAALVRQWGEVGTPALEQDFSPTLAGDQRGQSRDSVRRWLVESPGLVREASPRPLHLGVKIMNAMFDDAFQVEMAELTARAALGADVLVLFNRLWDAARGVAYGGWDLSDRNLRALDALRVDVPICATGNILSGRLMTEYARRGATSGQIHTLFQLPRSTFARRAGSRTARALHELFFHPLDGLLAWLTHLAEQGVVARREGLIRFLDVAHLRDGR